MSRRTENLPPLTGVPHFIREVRYQLRKVIAGPDTQPIDVEGSWVKAEFQTELLLPRDGGGATFGPKS